MEKVNYVPNFNGNDIVVISSANEEVDTITVGDNPIALVQTTAHLYVANFGSDNVSVIDVNERSVIKTLDVGSGPDALAVTPDEKYVYVTNWDSNNVSVISITEQKVITTIQTGVNPDALEITSDGSRVYIVNFGSNDVTVISTETNQVSHTIPVGDTPDALALSPDGSRVFVMNFGTNDVSIIDTKHNAVIDTTTIDNLPSNSGVELSNLQMDDEFFRLVYCTPDLTLESKRGDNCTYELSGILTCSGAPQPDTEVNFSSILTGSGSIMIMPNPATTDETGSFTATLQAAHGTAGTVTVTAQSTVRDSNVSATQTIPINCPPPPTTPPPKNPKIPNCIRTTKIYDWLYDAKTFKTTISIPGYPSDSASPAGITTNGLQNEKKVRLICIPSVSENNPPVCEIVDIKNGIPGTIKIRWTFYINMRTIDYDSNELLGEFLMPVQFENDYVICVPEPFTANNIVCSLIGVTCKNSTVLSGDQVEVVMTVCNEIEVQGEVKLELLGQACQPRSPKIIGDGSHPPEIEPFVRCLTVPDLPIHYINSLNNNQ
ncbi:beta-propeller fold lactonase family protein [Rossellomorea marisflavi]|uniref:beta-propeller fold lactonase family protein n=1 Tax=Rossellomorea marisflavi TaxID=189381 RepID=UPI00351238E6